MIEIKIIDRDNSRDINLPNEPFSEFGRVLVTYREGKMPGIFPLWFFKKS